MKRLISSRLARVLSVTLISTAALYGLTSQTPAYAGSYTFTPNEKFCMADAYLLEPGNSLPKDALNCTANDVEITQVVPLDAEAECTLGETFSFQADVTVRTNANERYDTTFYLPLTELSPKVVHGVGKKDCSMILPIPGDSGETADVDLDEDVCGDITKALGPDTYVLENETITMLCSDEDEDNRADFNYCAAWDNQERNNCTVGEDPYSGQIPNTKSKCNCDTFNIDVFIKPEPPTLTKTLIGDDSADEPQGIFKYEVVITNESARADIKVTTVNDIVRSSTDAAVFANFDLTATTDTSDTNMILLAEHAEHTCDTVLAGNLPITLTPSIPTVRCFIMVQIDDDNLPDDQSDELYQDFIRATVLDKNDDPVGDNTCDPTHPTTPTTPEDGTCSLVIPVAMQDVIPSITIDKFAIAGPGYECVGGTVDADGKCSGSVYIDEPGGDVTYKLVITNTSTVDPLTVTSLFDYILVPGTPPTRTDALNLLTASVDHDCDNADNQNLAISGEDGDSFTCTFDRDVSGGLITVHNEAEVFAAESAGHSEGNTADLSDFEEVTITDVPPMVALLKKVKAIGGPSDGAFADSAKVFEPEGDVVYQFTVTNNSVAQEDIRLLSLTDAVLDGSRVTQTGGDCVFNGTVTIVYGTPYVCTIEATVTGDASGSLSTLMNTALVTVTDEETNVNSNTDSATVTFEDVGPQFSLDFGFSTVVYVKISTEGVDAFEDLTLSAMRIRNILIPLPNGDAGDDESGVMNIINDNQIREYRGVDYESCTIGEVIPPDDVYYCNFVVEHLPEFADIDFEALATGAGPVEVILTDPENNAVKFEADITVTTTKRGPL
ncbi:hypothetical protein L4D76_05535 [Photobacterium sagamiensis]|uniref:hypothetical protein n=1 Tax=Photobacterium sagamiensis TaxID=2910241 RepID=UPI003D0DFCD7